MEFRRAGRRHELVVDAFVFAKETADPSAEQFVLLFVQLVQAFRCACFPLVAQHERVGTADSQIAPLKIKAVVHEHYEQQNAAELVVDRLMLP